MWLKDNGFYSIKVITATKARIPDIVGCTPCGKFFAIELKFGKNKASQLQEYNIAEITRRKGIAFVAYDLETVKAKLESFAVPACSLPPLSDAFLSDYP